MNQDRTILTAIDVGTTKVCVIIGSVADSEGVKVLAHSIVPSEGLRKGNVADIDATTKAIRVALKEAGQKAGISVQSAYVGVTGAHVSFENRRDTLEWASKRGVITAEDLEEVPKSVASSSASSGREVIHAIPMTYCLDGQKGIGNPLGMHSRELEVESHVVTGASSFMDKLVQAVESSGIKVDALVFEPLASSEAVLTHQERAQGAALVDIGGGTSDLVVFKRGAICYTSVLPVGGYQFTNDICQAYNTSYEAAEQIKLNYAHTEPHVVGADKEVSIPVVGRASELKVPHRDICQLMRERAQELIRLIKLKLEESQIGDISRVRLVITGGTSNLPGLEALVRQTLTTDVRVGVPNGHQSIPHELRGPAYATGVGLLLWAINSGQRVPTRDAKSVGERAVRLNHGIVARLLGQASRLIPVGLFSTKQGRVQWP